MESLLPAKSAPQISLTTAYWHEDAHYAGVSVVTNNLTKKIINRGILSKPISHKIKQTETDGQIIYTFGRLGGKAGGRSKRGRGREGSSG